MSDKLDELNNRDDVVLDDILSEFAPAGSDDPAGTPDLSSSGTSPQDPRTSAPPFRETPDLVNAPDNIVEFPHKEPTIAARLGRLIQKADDYAEGMFADEVPDPEQERAERLLPGVDWEETPEPDASVSRARMPRRIAPPAPDTPPNALAKQYARGLPLLRLRTALAFLLTLPLIYLALGPVLGLPMPDALRNSFSMQVVLSAGLLSAVTLLGLDVIGRGLLAIFRLRLGAETLVSFAVLAALTDALLILLRAVREDAPPYCAVAACALWFALWGDYSARRAGRLTCRTAASASAPYAVTVDDGKWNARATFSKWSGSLTGYGSQFQAENGVARAYHIAAPLLIIACVLFSLLASVGQGHPERLSWCLSATFAAAASFPGFLSFSLPFHALARRLSTRGAALGGWEGLRAATRARGALLTDGDLFPPGSVSLNGIKVFGDFDLEEVVSCTATLMRDSGSGLDKVFHDLLRTQGAVYRRAASTQYYEGGVTASIRGRTVYVGTAAFMALMDISLPQGLAVKNAVFCAIDGSLAGIFVLHYALHATVRPALMALIAGRVSPILATRDFAVIPAMLRQKFKLPVERMEFPSMERRFELSDPAQAHGSHYTAILCREGLAPFADALLGARRLVTAARVNVTVSLLASIAGVLLAFYLTSAGAYASLSPTNLLIFSLLWTLPTLLISGWASRY